MYAIGCRYYFTPLAGVLFTFPSRYLFTIGCQGVFSLIRWSGQIHAEFHVHRITWDTSRRLRTSLTRLSRSMAQLSRRLSSSSTYHIKVPQPREDKSSRFRLFRFRSPLLTESLRFLFLGLLRCFTSPRFASPDYEFIRRSPPILNSRNFHASTTPCRRLIYSSLKVQNWRGGFPIRRSPDQSLLAAPRGLSQLTTSFIASWHQGIHHKPLVA